MAAPMHTMWGRIHRVSWHISSILRRSPAYPASCGTGQRSRWQCTSKSSSLTHHLNEPPGNTASPLDAETEDSGFYTPIAAESGEQESLLLARPTAQPEDSRVLKVAIIGTPNAGKSTLINHLIGRRICAVSQKVHTTRKQALAVLTLMKTQVVLLDTPGLISFTQGRRHNLPRSLLVDARNTLLEADLIAVLVDVSNQWTNLKLDPELLVLLHTHPQTPAVLVLNKVDALQNKQTLFEITESLTEGVVDGQEFVSRKGKGRTADDAPPPSNLERTGDDESGGGQFEENEALKRMEDGDRFSDRSGSIMDDGEDGSGRLLGDIRDDDRKGDEKSVNSNTHDIRETVSERVEGIQDIIAQNHDRLENTTPKGVSSPSESRTADRVIDHGHASRSNELDVVKRDILEQYASNLTEFADDAKNEDAAGTPGKVGDAVAGREAEERTAQRKEMEQQREEKRRLWKMAKEKKGWTGFKAIFMISALHGDGVGDLKDFFVKTAKPGDWVYHQDVVTNLSPEEILRDAIREKLLETLPKEVPYNITQSTDLWRTGESGELEIIQAVICKKKSHLRMLEKRVGWIARQATQDLMDAFHCDVKLRIQLKFKK